MAGVTTKAKTTVPQIDAGDRLAIEDLIVDYAHAIDDDDLERWPDFFTDEAFYQIISRENFDAGLPLGVLSCEGRGMMQDRIVALRTANVFEPHTYCHLLSRPQFVGADGATWRVRTNFSVIRTMQSGESEIYATGKYADKIVLDEQQPLFQERRVVLESRQVDILLVIPL